jgi:hypothetical protein
MCKWIKSGNQRIDPCMKNGVEWANSEGHHTLACCCGHDKYEYTIISKEKDGKIREIDTGIIIPRKKRFYFRDSEGHFYIPEVEMWRYVGFCLMHNLGDREQIRNWIEQQTKI